MTKDDYKRYLASDHWKETRKAALARAKWKCQLCCSFKDLNVHHRTYANLGHEEDCDLTVLCRDCHAKFHGDLPKASPDSNKDKPLVTLAMFCTSTPKPNDVTINGKLLPRRTSNLLKRDDALKDTVVEYSRLLNARVPYNYTLSHKEVITAKKILERVGNPETVLDFYRWVFREWDGPIIKSLSGVCDIHTPTLHVLLGFTSILDCFYERKQNRG